MVFQFSITKLLGANLNVELNLSNYAVKADLKNAKCWFRKLKIWSRQIRYW